MRKVFIYISSIVLLALITMAYTAPINTNVDLVLPTGYTAPSNTNVDLVLDEAITTAPSVAGNITSTSATQLLINLYEDDDQ